MVWNEVMGRHHSDKPCDTRIHLCTHTGIYNVLYNMVLIWLSTLVLKKPARWCLWRENAT